MSGADAIATRATVRSLVAAFSATEQTIRASFAALVEAERSLNAAFGLADDIGSRFRIDSTSHGWHDNFDEPDRAVERLTRDAWRLIVERLELRRVMSIGRWEELDKQLRDGTLPTITEESVMAFARDNAASIAEMHAEAVGEVYEWLRGAACPAWMKSAGYKTNQRNARFELGERIILTGVVSRSWLGKGRFDVHHSREQRLHALERVFLALDGAGMTSRGYYSDLEVAIKAAEGGRGETPLFAFRACANGNLHLSFRRPDLLAAFNRVAGGRRLRGGPEGDVAPSAA